MVGEIFETGILSHGIDIVTSCWRQWISLQLRDNLITRRWESPDEKSFVYKTIVPSSYKENVFRELHESCEGGLFRVNRTLTREGSNGVNGVTSVY